ncbi:hypothetical protein T11_11401 [Trichinella zimbabwensis]|uniref:Uncharacterized protein n=1 Tax=Trichinella zimbabwensis TaxID=268475 RepID=A0A0V1GN62_9BILA|nr:hypothetical protein T11_11401 [Trichinella zimbabwensis]
MHQVHLAASSLMLEPGFAADSGSSGSLGIALPGDCTSWNRTENNSENSGT